MATAAERLKTLLEASGLSESAFARRIGVSRSLINRVLRGERSSGATVSPALSLAAYKALGLRTDYWLSDDPPERWLQKKRPGSVALGRAYGDAVKSREIELGPLFDEQRAVEIERESEQLGDMVALIALRQKRDVLAKRLSQIVIPPEEVHRIVRVAGADEEQARELLLKFWFDRVIAAASGDVLTTGDKSGKPSTRRRGPGSDRSQKK